MLLLEPAIQLANNAARAWRRRDADRAAQEHLSAPLGYVRHLRRRRSLTVSSVSKSTDGRTTRVLLALASQSLDLAMTLIPHIKAALAAHFTDRQKLLLDEFDRVLRDYAEHNEKIFSKFTNIVEDQIMKRFLENVAADVNYDASSVSIPSNPMKGITQNTLKLHAVLHPVLSPTQMKDVMTRVFDMFSQKLPDCFKHVQPKTPTGKSR